MAVDEATDGSFVKLMLCSRIYVCAWKRLSACLVTVKRQHFRTLFVMRKMASLKLGMFIKKSLDDNI